MGKYNALKILKETKARTHHICHRCGEEISPGKTYYREHIEDKFLHSVHAKKFCSSCFERYGDKLLSLKAKTTRPEISLEDFEDKHL